MTAPVVGDTYVESHLNCLPILYTVVPSDLVPCELAKFPIEIKDSVQGDVTVRRVQYYKRLAFFLAMFPEG
jgi:hypothetical protein